jgi:hypothetical protein
MMLAAEDANDISLNIHVHTNNTPGIVEIIHKTRHGKKKWVSKKCPEWHLAERRSRDS